MELCTLLAKMLAMRVSLVNSTAYAGSVPLCDAANDKTNKSAHNIDNINTLTCVTMHFVAFGPFHSSHSGSLHSIVLLADFTLVFFHSIYLQIVI